MASMTTRHISSWSSSVFNSECTLLHLTDISALAMVGGLVTPPLLLGGVAGANLGPEMQQYLISACLIWCAVGTFVQVSRIKVFNTRYYIGTGIVSVVGVSFASASIFLKYLSLCVSLHLHQG